MTTPYDRKVCCFGVVETSYTDDRPTPARRTRRGSVMVERSSVPRTILVPAPPAPATTNIYLPPSSYNTYTYSSVPAATVIAPSSPTTQQVDTTATAAAIAELLAPTSEEIRRQVLLESCEGEGEWECSDPSRQRDREVRAEVERRIASERWIDEEARRVVRERNSRDERRVADLRLLEDGARRRVEQGFRHSSSSLGSSREREFTSRERLVVVERASDTTTHRCDNCHEFGHRARDCEAVVVVNVASGRERRKSVSYRPRNQVRHVRGI